MGVIKELNSRFGIILVSLALIFSVFALIILNGSVAWLADNDTAVAEGFHVKAKPTVDVSAELKSFPVSEITKVNDTTYEYTVEYGDGDDQSYLLPRTDQNGISFSKYKKALVVIITVHSAAPNHIEMDLTASAAINTLISNANWISNCMMITRATLSSDGITATKGSDSKSFVNLGNPITKDARINLGVFDLDTGDNDICFIVEYNEDLVSHISAGLEGASDLIVEFKNDIEFIIY